MVLSEDVKNQLERQSTKYRGSEKSWRKGTAILQENCTTEIGVRWTCVKNLRGSSGRNTLVILEGKIRSKRAKGRPRRMWFDDVRQWTMLKDYNEVKRNAEDCETWRAITRQPST